MSRDAWTEGLPDDRPDSDAPAYRSARDQWEDEQNEPAAPPPRRGMSTAMKACLILFGLGAGCCLLCCGGVVWLFYSFRAEETTDPAKIEAARASIAKFDLPAGYKPKVLRTFERAGWKGREVVFENGAGNGMLRLIESQTKGGGAKEDDLLRRILEQQALFETAFLEEGKRETRKIKIKGDERIFDFIQGKDPDSGADCRKIFGTFAGKLGPVMIVVDVDESAYDEPQLIKMLESIH